MSKVYHILILLFALLLMASCKDENISVTDLISNKGLIKRTIFIKDHIRTTAELPDPNGYLDSAEEILLTNTNL